MAGEGWAQQVVPLGGGLPRRLENKEWNATPATNVTLRVWDGFDEREQVCVGPRASPVSLVLGAAMVR